jgi:hypothetical protein
MLRHPISPQRAKSLILCPPIIGIPLAPMELGDIDGTNATNHQTPLLYEFLFFGGLSAALWWTLYIVLVCLVAIGR